MQHSRYNTRSEPLSGGGAAAAHKDSAIVRRATLRRQRGAVERWTAFGVLFISVLGTVATLAGGWLPLIAGIRALSPNWAAIAGGAAIQALLTFLQWHYFDRPLVSWPARLADTVLTALGYGPLVVAALIAALAAREVPLPFYAAWGVIGLASLLTAWYPESRLVD
jgi:hypothetical protein